ncbi:MAG: glycosyltransferase family 4 protein, partial [Verrucomicrobiota bacterium]
MRILLAGLSEDRIEMHLLRTLREEGADIEAITCRGDTVRETCHSLGIQFEEHAFSGRLDRNGQRLIQNRLDQKPFDIIHAFSNGALSNTLMSVVRRQSREKVVGYRGTVGHLSRLDPASWMSYLNPRLDRIVCVSDAVKKYLRRVGVPDRKLKTIHKGHDPNWYQSRSQVDLRSFGIPAGAVTVGFIGNMRPVKGVDVLIRALRLMPESAAVHLLLFGDVRDPRIVDLAAHPRWRRTIHFAGFRPDAAVLARGFDIGVMPSVKREGFPKALVQYMVHGVPPIVTRVGGMPELVTHDESGLLIPPRDAKALADAMMKLVEDPALRRRLGDTAR